jgi:hypothetical protein
MKGHSRLYLFAALFLAVGIYQLVMDDIREFSLYALAASAFVLNALSLEPRLASHKKALSIAGWISIAITGILFLYLLQFKYL